MGNALATLFNRWFLGSHKQVRILMVGLDSAGKTTILYKLKSPNENENESVTTVPTIGFNVESVWHRNVHFVVWDFGGPIKSRLLWQHYHVGTDAVIFVVDSNDRDRLSEARDELHRMLSGDPWRECVVLVLANKQDLSCVMSAAEMTDGLALHDLKQRNWLIQPTCAKTGEGLLEGLDWLSSHIVDGEGGEDDS